MKEKGMVLLMTIIMLSILTIFILSLLQGVLLYVKASNQLAQRHQTFYELEQVAHELQRTIDPQCLVSGKNSNELVELLQYQMGCKKKVKQQSYVYLIEDLGVYPCIQISLKKERKSSHHWLFTIAIEKPIFEVLQFRIAQTVPLESCEQSHSYIAEGIVSWRHLLPSHDLS